MQFHVGSINLPVLAGTLFLESILMHDNTCRGVLLKLGMLANLATSQLCLSLVTKFWEGHWRSRRCLQL